MYQEQTETRILASQTSNEIVASDLSYESLKKRLLPFKTRYHPYSDAVNRLYKLLELGESFEYNRPRQLLEVIEFFKTLVNQKEQPFSAILNMATGTGKTHTFLLIMYLFISEDLSHCKKARLISYQNNKRGIIVVPTLVLIDQAIERWCKIMPFYEKALTTKPFKFETMSSIIANKYRSDADTKIIAICQQSLDQIAGKGEVFTKKREFLQQWYKGKRTLCVFDEAHLIYREKRSVFLRDFFGIKSTLLVSATADYPCGQIASVDHEASKIGKCFPLPKYSLEQAIEAKELVPILFTNVYPPVKRKLANEQKKSAMTEDFVEERVQRVLNDDKYHDIIAEVIANGKNKYGGHFFGERTLIICSGIDHANRLSEVLNNYFEKYWKNHPIFAGKDNLAFSMPYHSKRSSSEKIKTLASFKRGDLVVMIGVRGVVQGLDVPDIKVVINNSPSMMVSVELQKLGRGSRRADGKTHLDYVSMQYFPKQVSLEHELEAFRDMHVGYNHSELQITPNQNKADIGETETQPYVVSHQPSSKKEIKLKRLQIFAVTTEHAIDMEFALEEAAELLGDFYSELNGRKVPAVKKRTSEDRQVASSQPTSPTSDTAKASNDSQTASADNKYSEVLRQVTALLSVNNKKAKANPQSGASSSSKGSSKPRKPICILLDKLHSVRSQFLGDVADSMVSLDASTATPKDVMNEIAKLIKELHENKDKVVERIKKKEGSQRSPQKRKSRKNMVSSFVSAIDSWDVEQIEEQLKILPQDGLSIPQVREIRVALFCQVNKVPITIDKVKLLAKTWVELDNKCKHYSMQNAHQLLKRLLQEFGPGGHKQDISDAYDHSLDEYKITKEAYDPKRCYEISSYLFRYGTREGILPTAQQNKIKLLLVDIVNNTSLDKDSKVALLGFNATTNGEGAYKAGLRRCLLRLASWPITCENVGIRASYSKFHKITLLNNVLCYGANDISFCAGMVKVYIKILLAEGVVKSWIKDSVLTVLQGHFKSISDTKLLCETLVKEGLGDCIPNDKNMWDNKLIVCESLEGFTRLLSIIPNKEEYVISGKPTQHLFNQTIMNFNFSIIDHFKLSKEEIAYFFKGYMVVLPPLPNSQRAKSKFPLIEFTKRGKVRVVLEALRSHLYYKDNLDLTALMHAVKNNDVESARLLANAQKSPELYHWDKNLNTFLHMAVAHDNKRLLDAIKPAILDIDVENKDKQTPLVVAIINENYNAVKWLVANNADIKTKKMAGHAGYENMTVYEYALLFGKGELLSILTEQNSLDEPASLFKDIQQVTISGKLTTITIPDDDSEDDEPPAKRVKTFEEISNILSGALFPDRGEATTQSSDVASSSAIQPTIPSPEYFGDIFASSSELLIDFNKDDLPLYFDALNPLDRVTNSQQTGARIDYVTEQLDNISTPPATSEMNSIFNRRRRASMLLQSANSSPEPRDDELVIDPEPGKKGKAVVYENQQSPEPSKKGKAVVYENQQLPVPKLVETGRNELKRKSANMDGLSQSANSSPEPSDDELVVDPESSKKAKSVAYKNQQSPEPKLVETVRNKLKRRKVHNEDVPSPMTRRSSQSMLDKVKEISINYQYYLNASQGIGNRQNINTYLLAEDILKHNQSLGDMLNEVIGEEGSPRRTALCDVLVQNKALRILPGSSSNKYESCLYNKGIPSPVASNDLIPNRQESATIDRTDIEEFVFESSNSRFPDQGPGIRGRR